MEVLLFYVYYCPVWKLGMYSYLTCPVFCQFDGIFYFMISRNLPYGLHILIVILTRSSISDMMSITISGVVKTKENYIHSASWLLFPFPFSFYIDKQKLCYQWFCNTIHLFKISIDTYVRMLHDCNSNWWPLWYGTIPILRQQRDWVGGVRKIAIFAYFQYYLFWRGVGQKKCKSLLT